ncbi:hypothetical protein FBZ84_101180 [Azospirillum baldaniorum]|uniref:hypothetical protein n=1 Tax=Azospirillum baldaniorum TaxID=1064539 RepID=UPI0011A1A814|nr:hypothetical protein [Azospirillum baldaniorum]TWA71914.1 hypothetical protein FBZ84_101180 [Azospirillum baldaniorum]
MKSGVRVTRDHLGKVSDGIRQLAKRQAMVGVPGDNANRQAGEPITNAQLAYIHTFGAPEVNIPPRPFLQPGIAKAKPQIMAELRGAADAAIEGDATGVEIGLARAGQRAATAAQTEIRNGLQPPLSPATIANRAQRSAGSDYRRKATEADAKPLWDTGQLLRAITYVVRSR